MKGKLKDYLLLYSKGLAMGAADVVPGVSGGTIAFISGIYQTLLDSIKSFDGRALRLLFQFKLTELWAHVNGTFLLVLLAGIGTSILSLSKLILYLLKNEPIVIWSFFFGLIIASTVLVFKEVKNKSLIMVWVSAIIGALIAFLITRATPAETPEAYWFIFISGAIAICAMILPGISGSFILVLMVKYEFILQSLQAFNLPVIITFASGCVVGLLSFAHLLSYLLKRYHDLTVSLLAGFMVGSLYKVWPWKQVLETYIDRHGEVKPLVEQNLMPWVFQEATGQNPKWLLSLIFLIVGLALVLVIEYLASRRQSVG